jgi:lysophospholipase L1-like esterase
MAQSLRKVALNLVVVVTSIVVVLIVIEVGFRVFSPRKYFASTVNTWDRDMGTKQIPGAKGFVICPNYSMDLIINSKGLRDRDYTYAKPEDTYRILCLGDSFTCGYGVQAEETFAKVLERLLNADADRTRNWEVLNCGIGSTGTAHQLAYFKTEGHKYNPDLALLCFCWANDFWDNLISGLYSLEQGQLVKHDAARTPSRRIQTLVRWIPGYHTFLAKSHLLSFVRFRVARSHYRELGERFAVRESYTKTVEKEEALTRRLILCLHDACKSIGCQLVITVVPPREGREWDMETSRLLEYVREQGIPLVDLTLGFRRQAQQGVQNCHPRDGHWNKNGHHLVAEILYEFFANASQI